MAPKIHLPKRNIVRPLKSPPRIKSFGQIVKPKPSGISPTPRVKDSPSLSGRDVIHPLQNDILSKRLVIPSSLPPANRTHRGESAPPPTTLFINDFSQYTAESPPDDWSEINYVGDGVMNVETSAFENTIGGKELALDMTGNSDYTVAWDLVPQVEDVEVLALIRPGFVTDGLCKGLWLRLQGEDGDASGYYVYMRHVTAGSPEFRLYIARLLNNSFSYVSSTYESYWNSTDYYWVRFRIVGSDIKLKIWLYGDSEPSSWDLEETNSDVTGAGYVAWSKYSLNWDAKLDYFAVDINADTISVPGSLIFPVIEDLKTDSDAAQDSITVENLVVSGENRILVVMAASENKQAVSATWDAAGVNESLTAVAGASISTTATTLHTYTFQKIAPTAKTANVTVTFDTGVANSLVFAYAISGATQEAPYLDEEIINLDAPTGITCSPMTVTSSGTLFLDMLGMDVDSSDPTAKPGQVEQADIEQATGSIRAASSYKLANSGSETMGWSWAASIGRCSHVVVGIRGD